MKRFSRPSLGCDGRRWETRRTHHTHTHDTAAKRARMFETDTHPIPCQEGSRGIGSKTGGSASGLESRRVHLWETLIQERSRSDVTRETSGDVTTLERVPASAWSGFPISFCDATDPRDLRKHPIVVHDKQQVLVLKDSSILLFSHSR